MATEGIDVIQHLLDVEKNATSTLLDAQKKADDIIAEAKVKIETKFKDSYAELVKEINRDEELSIKEIDKKHKEEIDSFKNNLLSVPKDLLAFNDAFAKLFSDGRA